MRLPTARAVAGGTGSGPHEGQAVGRAASLQGFGSVAVLRASLQGCSQCPEDRRVERKSQVRVRRVCADLEPPTPPPSSLGLLEKPIPRLFGSFTPVPHSELNPASFPEHTPGPGQAPVLRAPVETQCVPSRQPSHRWLASRLHHRDRPLPVVGTGHAGPCPV